MSLLQLLDPAAANAITEEFYAGKPITLDESYLIPYHRRIELDALVNLCARVQSEYRKVQAPGDQPWQSSSDAWLASRIHAALRLTRKEAADRRLWNYLAICELRDYVHWRWRGNERTPEVRFWGADNKQAIKRLWWGAELSRNGDDYGLTRVAFSMQDIPNTILSLRAMHNKTVAIAVLRFIDANKLNGKQINVLSTKLNTAAMTVSLDMLAPVPQILDHQELDWYSEHVELDGNLPKGPGDQCVDEEAVARVTQLLHKLSVVPGKAA
jgi:hypothetical protein